MKRKLNCCKENEGEKGLKESSSLKILFDRSFDGNKNSTKLINDKLFLDFI